MIDESILEKTNALKNIPNAVKNIFSVNKNKKKKKESIRDDIASNLSIDSSDPKDTDVEKINKIFLVVWTLHAVLGVITLFTEYSDRKIFPRAYKYVLIMTFKWLISAFFSFIMGLIFFIF